ncbi:sodium:calcium antiporter [Desulfobacter hydrogenophilus]|uniref:Sodium:calcium antiporter n=1 Tax=Desulfobacter hydrogenophilus TaxID=2291 RepID=A0A328FCS8_9BACT|nr:sodium:calcium antiporter [Desulfobacter hydrogenophilus]NDY72486.1 sodium:calcium antiporter [Desulfobacter hydrogenophilus]QBH14183.1 sodium:calcium antiporter [Desulfobacter hydrogenophilus]RAM01530.1 sodium:calcium antiporter [Desulfobacter hydrogenophilus]
MDVILHTWYGGLILMMACSYIIAKSCDVFESATDCLGSNLNDGVKGATLNAIGSSMPELLTTVFFLILAEQENLGRDFAASIGGNAGSAIFNSIIIPMLVIWVVLGMGITGVKVSKKVILRDGLFLIGAEIMMLLLLSSNYITHWHGWVFTGFYVIYLAYTLLSMKNGSNEKQEDYNNGESDAWFEKYQFRSKEGIKGRSWILLLGSTLVMAVACAGIVEGCKGIADALKIHPLFVALILVAAVSSVPDTIISIKDAKKGNYDDALSNVLGSNIFDITISMGLPLALFLLFTGQKIDFIEAGPTFIDVQVMLLLVTIVTIGIYYFSEEMRIPHVFVLGVIYVVFILYAIGAAEYLNGGNSFLTKSSGAFIEFLRQPGGISEFLQNASNGLTGSW